MVEEGIPRMSHGAGGALAKVAAHPWTKLLLAVFAVQAAYWLVFYPNMVRWRPEERPAFVELQGVQQAKIETPDKAGLDAADFEPFDPSLRMFEKGVYATRISFELDEVPPSGLALLDNASGDHIRYVVNGEIFATPGSAEFGALTYNGSQKRIMQVAPVFLREGTNTLDSIIVFDLPREADIPPPLLGEYEAVEAAFSWTDFLFNDWRNTMIGVTFTLALLVGFAALRATDRAIPAWLFLLTISWALHALFYRWIDFPLQGFERGAAYSIIFLFMSACWPVFVDAWTEKPLRFFREAILALFGLGAAIIGWFMLVSQPIDAFTVSEEVLDQLGLVFVVATIGRLVWHFVRNPAEDRVWEAAVMILLATLIGWFLYNTWVHDTNVGVLPGSQPVLILALAVAFFARRFHLFRSSNEINRLLQAKLDLREAELAEAHEREKRFVRQQAFGEERQRIMRDMHDGLGSQLMSMLLAARRGKAEPDRVAEGLQQVIDEMRLMIDSMDSVGESLDSALASYRNRLQPRIEDAGFKFVWVNRIAGALPDYPPRKTLQLFRILQEAVTNALKHSGGSTIAVLLEPCAERRDWLCISVTDDGKGIAQQGRGGRSGHGLENMRVRARSIGAEIDYGAPEGGGGSVRVSIPPYPAGANSERKVAA